MASNDQKTTFEAASDYVTDCANAVGEGLGLKEKSTGDKATEAAHKVTGTQSDAEKLGDATSDAAAATGLKEKSKTEKATDKAVSAKESVKEKASSAKEKVSDAVLS